MSKKGTQKDPAIMEEIPEEEAIAALGIPLDNKKVEEKELMGAAFDDEESQEMDALATLERMSKGVLAVKDDNELKARSVFSKVMGVMRADIRDRAEILDTLPETLRPVAKNLATALDVFKVVSRESNNLAQKAWGNVLAAFGKVIKGIGKHLGSQKIEEKGKAVIRVSKEILGNTKSLGYHAKDLSTRREIEKAVQSSLKGGETLEDRRAINKEQKAKIDAARKNSRSI